MNPLLSTLGHLVHARITAHTPLIDVQASVFNEAPRKGETASDTAAAIGALVNASLADLGIALVVRAPVIRENTSEAPGGLLTFLVQVECHENASLNATGWGKDALAVEVFNLLHDWFVGPLGLTLTATKTPVAVETTDEALNYVVSMTAIGSINPGPQCSQVSFAQDGETKVVTLTCETAGASIYYLIKGADELDDYPAQGNADALLYESPFDGPTEEGMRILAVAFKDGHLASDLGMATLALGLPPEVTNITAPTANHNTLDLEWTSEPWADGWEIEVMPHGGNWATDIIGERQTSLETSYSINADAQQGPGGNESFDVRIRAVGATDWTVATELFTGFNESLMLEYDAPIPGVGSCQINGPDFNASGYAAAATFNVFRNGVQIYTNQNTWPKVVTGLTLTVDNTIVVTWSNGQRTGSVSATFYAAD
jgi:hypothetical protein